MGASITVSIVTGDKDVQVLVAKIKEALSKITTESVNVNVTATIRQVDINAVTSYNRMNKRKQF